MIYALLIALSAFAASFVSFYSGFGLGTVLTAVFCFFYPAETAITISAIVHLLNNLYKFYLMRSHLQLAPAIPFLFAAIPSAMLGAWFLQHWAWMDTYVNYDVFSFHVSSKGTSFALGIVLIIFAFTEGILKVRYLRQSGTPVLFAGGLISGFVGGLTGNQGALRSFFLIHAIPDKKTFVATGVAIALFLDISRIPFYRKNLPTPESDHAFYSHLLLAVLFALAGAWLGKKSLIKSGVNHIQTIFQFALFLLGLALVTGMVS
ncbi:MAG: TSUP family transporter [Bacteroidota bacterium]|jgi:uncharacterized membrane protein YfcA